MKLKIPKEPKEVKEWIRTVESHNQKDLKIDWDSLNVWYGNKLPQYLWDEWKDDLKPEGFTWQNFLKLLKHRTDQFQLWYGGRLKWPDLIKEISEILNGQYAKEITK